MTPAMHRLHLLPAALAPLLVLALAGCAQAEHTQDASAAASHDYPTAERVISVQACMREHPDAGYYEILNKCACALDYMARTLTFDEYDTLHTASLAASIGGERGAVFRDAPGMQEKIKAFRKLQSEAQASCMIAPPTTR